MAKLCLNLILILGQRDNPNLKQNRYNKCEEYVIDKKTRIYWKIAKVLVNLNGMEGQQTDRVRRFRKLQQMPDKIILNPRDIYQIASFFSIFSPLMLKISTSNSFNVSADCVL